MHDETHPIATLLVENHREFLRYVERRVGDRATAEEIVQDAFVRSLDRGDEIRDSVIGWFYRVLRNAVIDHQRRKAVVDRRLDEFAAELETTGGDDDELARVACRCVTHLADTLNRVEWWSSKTASITRLRWLSAGEGAASAPSA